MSGGFDDIIKLGARSYADVWQMLTRAGALVFTALAILGAGEFAGIFAARLFVTPLGRTLIGTLATIASLWFATPYLVRLLRGLLADRTDGEEAGTQVLARFFAWSSLFAFLAALPEYAFARMPADLTPADMSNGLVTLIWVTFVLLLAIWVFTARAVTLLPAIACGQPVTLREALAHTAGRSWFVMGAVLLPVVPLTLIGRLVIAGTGGFVFIVLSVLLSLAIELVALVVSANLYRWLMDHRQ